MTPFEIFTIGHSNHSTHDFIALLKEHGIEKLADIRAVPRSRHNPQFNSEALKASLAEVGIIYHSWKNLGGIRKALRDSPNQGLGDGFRGYADYMQTPEFSGALDALMDWAEGARTALMCAEAHPSQCHRSLTSDALVARGHAVTHILSQGKTTAHILTPFAEIREGKLFYPFALT